jgi:hypothetical protein
MSSIFVNTVGLRIYVEVGINISAAGSASIRAEKPDGTDVTWAATIADAAVGRIFYDTTTGDLDQVGTWKINGLWDPDGVNIFWGKTACLLVRALGTC